MRFFPLRFALALSAVLTFMGFALATMITETGCRLQVSGCGLEVYEVDGLTDCRNIDFGSLAQGESAHHNIIVKNTCDYAFTLNMSSSLDASVGTVSWNYSGSVLNPGEALPLSLTLNVEKTAPRGTYNFELTIYAWISEG